MIYLARRKWWLMLAVVVADWIIALAIGDTVIRWEIEVIRDSW